MKLKKLTLGIAVLLFLATSCGKSELNTTGSSGGSTKSCGSHNGKTLSKGSEGGCYYINSNGNKTYVDRSECNC